MKSNNIIKISLKGALLAILFMVIFISIVVSFDRIVPFEFFSVASLISFLFVGAYEMKLFSASESGKVALNDDFARIIILTPFLTLIGVALILVISDIFRNGFKGVSGVLDILGVFTVITPFWLLGTPVMIAILFLGAYAYSIKTKQKKAVK